MTENTRKLTVEEQWGVCCPNCGRDDQLDVAALVFVRLTPDGTDVDDAVDGSHEWDDEIATQEQPHD